MSIVGSFTKSVAAAGVAVASVTLAALDVATMFTIIVGLQTAQLTVTFSLWGRVASNETAIKHIKQ